MDPQKRKELLVGPGIVAGANAMRAFDAPIRYPLVLKNYELIPPDPAIVPVRSIFIVLVEHIIGTVIMFAFLFSRKAHTTLKKQLDSLNFVTGFPLF